MANIKSITAREILDSRANPTVEATVMLDDGSIGVAAVPSGASTGSHEAVELRDNDPKRYHGAGVLTAIKNIQEVIAPAVGGLEASAQKEVDDKMIALDGTPNKAHLGANAILAVSLATARAAAASQKLPLYVYLAKLNPDFAGKYILPIPLMNIMNGGQHANWATDIQEYMILPLSAKTMADAVRMGAEVYAALKKVLKTKNYGTSVGDEGGFAPAVKDNSEPFALMSEAIVAAGYQSGKDIYFGIDAAASEFFVDGNYSLKRENKILTAEQLSDFYGELKNNFPIITMEDVFAEDDWTGFADFTKKFGDKLQIVGDDLYVTNIERINRGVAQKSTNSVLIKLNQIGTLSETIAAITLAHQNKLTAVISHRSGETNDDFIADLSVAFSTGQIKTGAPARSERTAKYNRLMEIERELGENGGLSTWPFSL